MTNVHEGIPQNFGSKILNTLIDDKRIFKIQNSMFSVDVRTMSP